MAETTSKRAPSGCARRPLRGTPPSAMGEENYALPAVSCGKRVSVFVTSRSHRGSERRWA